MKFVFGTPLVFVLLMFFVSGPVPARGATPIAISRADFYPRGAKITFSVPYFETIHFELPGTFDAASVRPIPSDGLSVLSFKAVEIPRPGWIPAQLEELWNSIKKKEEKIAILAGKISAIRQSFNILSGPLPKDLKGEDIPNYVEATRKTREGLEIDLIALTTSIEKAQGELETLKNDFSSRIPKNVDRGIAVSAQLSGRGELLVEAWTRYAEWHPFYRMNLDSTSGTISVSLLAKARQQTGILFDGDLYFNTSTPSTTVAPPDLPPLVADFVRKKQREAGTMEETKNFPNAASCSEAPMLVAAMSPDIVQTMTYMSTKATGWISGDNATAEFQLGEFTLKGEPSIVVVPTLSEQAWITVESNNISFPILHGSAELSVDGQPSAKTVLSEQGVGTDFILAFGKMPLVKATREKIVPKEGNTWTGKGHIEDGYSIEIVNGLPSKITILVKDRIPLSTQEKISVETVKIEPKPAEIDKQNIVSWKLDFDPGEKKTLNVIFKLSFPADETVTFH